MFGILIRFGANSRRGLSCSLNFRARTNATTSTVTTIQQALSTALGYRPDAMAMIRELLTGTFQGFDATIEKARSMNAAPAYLILCSPDKTAILEKDFSSATVTTSDTFLACANHDRELEDWTEQEYTEWAKPFHDPLLSSSIDRKQCAIDSSHHVKNVQELKTLLQTWPVLNSLTTFGVIMSPERGTIDWEAWYKERPEPPSGMEQWGGEFTPAAAS